MKLTRTFSTPLALGVLVATLAWAAPEDQQYFTDFQGLDAEDPAEFSIGPADFTNGDAFSVGVPVLYHGDDRAWVVGPGKTARIDFQVPMGVVELRAVGLDGAEVHAVGDIDQISTVDVTGDDISDPQQALRYTGEIEAIVFTNTSEAVDEGQYDVYGASLDDLGFTPFDVAGRCTGEQLKAGAGFCKRELSCWSKYVKKPEKDAGGTKRDSCIEKALKGLRKAHEKAIAKAEGDGGSCPLDDALDDFVDEAFLDRLAALRDAQLLLGWDPETAGKDENKLRSKLMKDVGKLCTTAMKLESKSAMDDDPDKAAAKRGKARDKFESKAGKNIAKGAKKGVEDPGFDPEEMGDQVDDLVDAFRDLTTGPGGAEDI